MPVDPQPDRRIAEEDPEGGRDELRADGAGGENLSVDRKLSALVLEADPHACVGQDRQAARRGPGCGGSVRGVQSGA